MDGLPEFETTNITKHTFELSSDRKLLVVMTPGERYVKKSLGGECLVRRIPRV